MVGTFIAGWSDFFTSPEPGFLFQDVINGVMGQDHHGTFIFQVDRFVSFKKHFSNMGSIYRMQVSCHFGCVGSSLCCSLVLILDVNPSVSPPVVGNDSFPCEGKKRCVFPESALSDCISRFTFLILV